MNTNKTTLTATMAAAAGFALLLGGCSPTATETSPGTGVDRGNGATSAELDALVLASQGEVAQVLDLYSDTYSDFRIEGEAPNTLVYVYVFIEQLDQQVAADALAGQADLLRETCDTQVIPGMTEAGVPNPSARYDYINADGSEIWSYTC